MLEVLTDEEVAADDEEVRRMYASPKLEDQLVAILMDTHVGGHGDREEDARIKVRAILEHMHRAA